MIILPMLKLPIIQAMKKKLGKQPAYCKRGRII
jgi:hypothetical protein